jgi:Ca-activated chloride channel homolog
VATATVRWLDPVTRTPDEASGSVTAWNIDRDLWGDAPTRLQVTAVAAYFAEYLREGSMPGDPGLKELSSKARELADSTEDKEVGELAESIERARNIRQ